MKQRNSILPFLLVLSMALTSCATPVAVTETDLIPLEEEQFKSIAKSILVKEVLLAKRPQPSTWDPGPVTFPEAGGYIFALTTTLSKSGLFTEVKNDGDADYSLSANVVGERVVGLVSNVVLILIRYKLIETNTEDVIWEENIFSHYALTAEQEFVGTTRIAKALEGAIRSNMNQLDDRLAQVLQAN